MGPVAARRIEPPKGSTWLVTGGAGFLGRAVIDRIVAAGAAARSLDIHPVDPDSRVAGAEYIQGDVRDPAAVRPAIAGVDYVVHAAAALPIQRSRRRILATNVHGTRNVLAAARQAGVKGVVFVSSTAVYGLHRHHPILEDSPMRPVGPYGESKVAAEQLCRQARDDGLHVCVLRCKTFLGPGRLGVFQILFDWIRRGKRIYTIGPGTNRYQLLDAGDLIDAMLLGVLLPDGNDDFNVGAHEFGTIRDDLKKVIRHAATSSRVTPLPARTSKAALFILDKLRLSPLTRWHYGTMDRESYVDIQKVQRRLGWTPTRSNAQALIDAYDWYVQRWDSIEGKTGTTHTVPWNQRALAWLRRIS